ncbi:MAG: hypothetical protein O3C21_00375 [Verrucomicrobia bacterium]|nr:hypothetical protein [Verrucomicrobiota bacterium]
MMKTVQFLLSLGLSIAMGTAVAQAEEAAKPVNSKCPVSGKAVDAEQTSTYTKVVGFCCGKCLAKHNKNPAANVAKIAEMPADKIVNTKCPVSGKAIDAEQTAMLHGAKVGFCCEKCLGKFKEDPEALAAKVVYDNAANEECPASGEAVDPEQVATFTAKVAFCCEKCKAKFDEAPDKSIAKVEFDSVEKK